MRNWNSALALADLAADHVWSLPMRNWNRLYGGRNVRSNVCLEPTYEELEQLWPVDGRLMTVSFGAYL